MKKFIIEEEMLIVYVERYELETESHEEAERLYCEELAGNLTPIHDYYKPYIEGYKPKFTVKPV